ncbi:MAG: NAD-binding protein [Thermodesulfobacteriota bacterium]
MAETAQEYPGKVVVVGCGRLGAILASELSRIGSQVVVIDRNRAAFAMLDTGFSGFQVTGDAIELDVLRAADLAAADCLLATTEKDTVNLMVTQVARTVFAVPRVLARVYDPRLEDFYRSIGIAIISPTSLTAREFLQVIARPEARS